MGQDNSQSLARPDFEREETHTDPAETPLPRPETSGPHRPAPLAGVLVIDLSRHLPGPLVSRILADLGARVIKVEEPKLGDPARHSPPAKDGKSSLATLLLAGHESLALDLKQATAVEALDDLLGEADVLIESFRPGTMTRLGLDPAELRKRHPHLVLCSVSGFGQDGPHAHRAGHDLTYQALAGSLASTAAMPAVQVADIVGAWSAASAVLACLYRRDRDGDGAWIDQALFDAAGHAAIAAWAAETEGAKDVGEPHMLTGAIPCYDIYPTADGGHLALACLEPKFWQKFCQEIGRKDLMLRQFSPDPAVRREIAALVAARTRDAWASFFHQHDLPAEPVLSLGEATAHPQWRHRELVLPGQDDLPRMGYPAKLDGLRPRGGERLAGIGEDTERLVEEFDLAAGLSKREKRRGGIGKKRSVRRWLIELAGRAVSSRTKRGPRRPPSDNDDDG